MEQAPFSVQVFAPDGRTVRVNRAWEELWGVTLDQIADYNMLDDPQLEAKGVLPYIRRAFAGRAGRHPGHPVRPERDDPRPHPPRGPAAVGVGRRLPAQGRRRAGPGGRPGPRGHHRPEAGRGGAAGERAGCTGPIGESIDYGVWVCDPAGRNTYVSESFLRLVGLDPGGALRPSAGPRCCTRTTPTGPSPPGRSASGPAGRGTWSTGSGGRTGGGTRSWPAACRCGTSGARSPRWAGINLDISRLKRVEDELREADRRKDEFLATLAHELRNPLAPIRNSLQILKMPRVDAETVERSREMMERQVEHLVRLVDDLLDVSRVMRGKVELRRERVELAAVVGPGGGDGPAADRRPGPRADGRPPGRAAAGWTPTRCGWPRSSATC